MSAADTAQLADACAAALLFPSLMRQQKAMCGVRGFNTACSLRISLLLGNAAKQALVLVSDDLRGLQGAAAFWPAMANRSFSSHIIRRGRPGVAESPTVGNFADLRHLNDTEGAHRFVCLPICAPAKASKAVVVAALLLSYPTAAAPPQDLRLALALASQLSHRHGAALQQHVNILASTMLPPEEHASWGPGVDSEYPELSSGACSEDEGGSVDVGGLAGAGSPAWRAVGADLALHASTLRFADRRVERNFRMWRSQRMARLDAVALGSLFVCQSTAGLLPPFAACRPGGLTSAALPALLVLAPLLLLLLRPCQRWYRRHRDGVLIATYLTLASHLALDLAPQLQGAPEGMWHVVLVRAELAWSLVLGVLLQVQFVGQCATLAAGLLLKALFLPSCLQRPLLTATPTCTNQPPGSSSWLLPARGLLLKLLAPCAVAYCMELSARRAYCRTVARAGR